MSPDRRKSKPIGRTTTAAMAIIIFIYVNIYTVIIVDYKGI